MRFWYWLWDDWFSVNVGWVMAAVALGILTGAFVAELRFERRLRRQSPEKTVE